jgi:hypothetical protein
VKPTLPLPVPPFVPSRIHDAAVAAGHEHPGVALTVKLPLPPPASTVVLPGDSEKLQAAAFWFTV